MKVNVLKKPGHSFFRALTRHYESLQNIKTNFKNQLYADNAGMYANKQVSRQLNKLIETVDKQIAEIVKSIECHIYSGYDLIENQSGKQVGKTRISKKGNRHIRRILHMPAFNVVHY